MVQQQQQGQLAAYARIWAATHVLRMSSAGFHTHSSQLQLALLVLTAACPAVPAVLVCAMAARLLGLCAKMPLMHDSQYLAFLLDCVLLLVLLAYTCTCTAHRMSMVRRIADTKQDENAYAASDSSTRSSIGRWLTPIGADEQQRIVAASAQPTLRMLGVFYFAAGFWKINTGFLNPSYSCGTILFLQLMDHLPTAAASYPPLVHLVARAAPPTTIAVEMGTGLLLVCPLPILGAGLMLVLHVMIGLTPPPNNIACFGCVTCSRLFFLEPADTTAALHEIASTPHLAAAAMGLAAAAIGITRRHHADGAPLDAPLVFLSLLCFLLARAASRSRRVSAKHHGTKAKAMAAPPHEVRWQRCAVGTGWCMVCAMVVYALLFPMLGVMDLGLPNMFSNLRMYQAFVHDMTYFFYHFLSFLITFSFVMR